jgi:hypothetical protein
MANYISWTENLVPFATEGFNFDECKSEGLHEKQEPSHRLLERRGKPGEPVSSWPVTGPFGCALNSIQQSGNLKPLSLSLILRPTVSRPVCLGIKHPSGAYDQIFISF